MINKSLNPKTPCAVDGLVPYVNTNLYSSTNLSTHYDKVIMPNKKASEPRRLFPQTHQLGNRFSHEVYHTP